MEVSQPEEWAEVRRVVWMVGMEEVARRVVLRVVRREGGRGRGMGRGMGRRGGVVVVDMVVVVGLLREVGRGKMVCRFEVDWSVVDIGLVGG